MRCCCETYVKIPALTLNLVFEYGCNWKVLYCLSVLGFPLALNMAGNLIKDKGFLCLLIIPCWPCIFDQERLVDEEILLNFPRKFSRQSEIFPAACVMRKIRDLNSL